MRSLGSIPPALIEQDSERSMPPGGGLMMVLGGSFLFWAALIWAVLR